MKIKLPKDVITYNGDGYTAHTIAVENFEKLIGWQTDKHCWVHKDYRIKSKKKKK